MKMHFPRPARTASGQRGTRTMSRSRGPFLVAGSRRAQVSALPRPSPPSETHCPVPRPKFVCFDSGVFSQVPLTRRDLNIT
jgi:hypothetical protein